MAQEEDNLYWQTGENWYSLGICNILRNVQKLSLNKIKSHHTAGQAFKRIKLW